jgi:nicotinamide phosphoribosyltransferase
MGSTSRSEKEWDIMAWEDQKMENEHLDDPYAMEYNPITDTDSYKFSHPMQYPEGLTSVFSYIESRGGHYGVTMWAGLQMLLKRALCRRVTMRHVEKAAALAAAHGEPFPYEGWKRVVEVHNGYRPLRIRAVAEGTVVPTGNILAAIESTDPLLPWMNSWHETQLMRVWYPTTVATKSYFGKKEILAALAKSSNDPMGEIYFKLHDFGARGVSSWESAGLGGAAHLFNFKGSDTITGIEFANHYYNEPMAGFSIPAAEHSTMTIKGREGELSQMRRMIEQFAKKGATLACVSDSYDVLHAVESYWGEELHDLVRNSGATVVIRPDSGDPSEVNLKILQILERKIGMTKNLKGYKVLPNYFRLIQGDGNDDEISIRKVLNTLMDNGYSASNIAFGMGGGLLQKLDRDTQKFAMKASQAIIDNQVIDVYKDPITDPGKKSKRGRLDLVFRNNQYQTVQGDQPDSLLVPVFENGKLLKDFTLAEARKNAEATLL